MTNKIQNIFFLGCGKMGSVVANNIIEQSKFDPKKVTVLKRSDADKIKDFNYIKNTSELAAGYQADLVFIAIKPQGSQETLEQFTKENIFHKNTIFVSILAGKTLGFFQNIFGDDAKIIRSMPNLPIEYSQGILPYARSSTITDEELAPVQEMFNEFGIAFEVKDENSFDSLSAMFGSGPAYIFMLQEIMLQIALNFGVAKEDGTKLVKKLFLGSSLMSNFSKKDFTSLRESVTSKAGITDAALKVLQKDTALENIFKDAIDAAVSRAKEI